MNRIAQLAAAIFISMSTPAFAGTIYSSVVLEDGSPASMSRDAWGLGFVSDTNSIQFATPFTTPNHETVATSLRVAARLEFGTNAFAVSLFSDDLGKPNELLTEVFILDSLRSDRIGHINKYWLDITLSTEIHLNSSTQYWISLSSLPGSDTFFKWFMPNTDISVVHQYRNTTIPNGDWKSSQSYYPPAFEIIGEAIIIPEPASICIFLLGLGFLATRQKFVAQA
ncbi:choice-of-anchor R domain-containing protein [Rhodospirillaceae bacterium SYSU D60014]|uniref:choice-of-anchor R domain-containing protein n=1 Tax=Virgifigura deserti TaxID=2268457 RepID=UPI000E673473